MLCFAPKPVPTATAVGVARPRASGQAITIAEIAKVSANNAGCLATRNHTRKVTSPDPTARTTRYFANLSASLWPGALEFWATSTSLTICASAVSSPTFVASNLTEPDWLMEPPITASPSLFGRGIDSPVTRDSSIAVSPCTILPSTGTLSPGFRITISPIFTSEVGTSSSLLSRRTLACGGTRANNS